MHSYSAVNLDDHFKGCTSQRSRWSQGCHNVCSSAAGCSVHQSPKQEAWL